MMMKKRNENRDAVLFVDRSAESLQLLQALKSRNALRGVKMVEVDGLRGWLILEYGVARVPLLVTENKVISNPEEIISFLTGDESASDEH